jgi:small-conductance mechanosensitive channel
MENWLEEKYWNNTVQDYLIAAGGMVIGFVLIRLFRNIVLTRLRAKAEATETSIDDLLVDGVERFLLPVTNFSLLYSAIHYLNLSERVSNVVHYATVAVIAFFAVRIITRTITLSLQSYVRKQENGDEKIKQMRGIIVVINAIVWALGLVFLFDNLGYNVTAIITGLGIGGIAIALAAQNILGDLFNYFVIFFDRPFEIGDFVQVDDKLGVVENIGVKTTRHKTLRGEQLVFANTDLTNARLHNFKKLTARRVVFPIGVVYETPYEKVKAIPGILKKIIESEPKVRYDRAHFAAFGDFSLNFEIVYYIDSADYNENMDAHQKINMNIMQSFANQGIEFAYPTQTIILNKQN